jgi:hypothetical protein
MDAEAAAPDFFDDLGDCCAFKSGMTHVQGTRYGSSPHIHVVQAAVAVLDVYAHFYSWRQCWASKSRGL